MAGTVIVDQVTGYRAPELPLAAVLDGTETVVIIIDGLFYRTDSAALVALIGGPKKGEEFIEGTNAPSLDNWQENYVARYGNWPRFVLLTKNDAGNYVPELTTAPDYIIDSTDPENIKLTRVSWDLAEPRDCVVLIN